MPVAPELEPYCTRPGQGATEMPDLADLRPMFEAMASMWDLAEPSALRSTEHRIIPGPAGEIPVVVYTPEGEGPRPVVLFIHGGGFFLGSAHSHGPVAREIAARSGRVVVSVDYRLTPEHEFPAAVDDCFAALQWLAASAGDVGGDPAQPRGVRRQRGRQPQRGARAACPRRGRPGDRGTGADLPGHR